MSNPFQQAPPQAPAVPDTAPPQFAQQTAPNAFAQQAQFTPAEVAQMAGPTGAQPSGYMQATAQMVDQVRQRAPQTAPNGMPGQPWTPQQHQASGQAPYGNAPQPVPATPQPTDPAAQFTAHAAYQQAPANFQTHQAYVQQQAPQATAPAFATQPQSNGVPAFAQQAQPQMGAPAFAQPGGAVDPGIWSAPAAGGMGRRPGWRDLRGRFVLIRVTARNVERDTYDKKGKEFTLDANIAVLDGGQIVMSPKMGDPNSVAEVFSNVTPCVIDGMIITSKGMQNRLKTDFVRGRIVREPIHDLQKMLKDTAGDEPLWWKLEQWLAQDASRVHDFKQSIMWSIVEDSSPEANALTASFCQSPEGQTFCR